MARSAFLLALLLVVVVVLASAQAPPEVTISYVNYAGSGCNYQNTNYVLSNDYKTVTFMFGGMVATTDGSLADKRKSCQMSFNMIYPDGWSVSIGQATGRGFADIAKDSAGIYESHYYFSGQTDKKYKEGNEVAKLREEIAKLAQRNASGEASTSVVKPPVDFERVERLKREQEELRAVADRRFAMLEEKISGLVKEKSDAEASAELWKAEALRPGNKRGSIAVETPGTEARVRQRGTPCKPPTDPRVNPVLKGMVDRHNLEVNTLKELRLKDAHDRIEEKKEVERLKEAMAKLEMAREKGTNLKSKLDEAAGPSTRKTSCTSAKKKMCAMSPAEQIDEREAFALMQRKRLKKLNKDQISAICDKEGIVYTKLEQTKEEIVCQRVARAFEDDKGKEVSLAVVTEEESEDLGTNDGQDTAVS
ncbi:hypothetical protein CBR_g68753 [Chara braunii]|uniref:Uncharacterized protein n=1 Tax=Chara braunii TaxID=69332 RepID=A0A388K9R3_CHABU|nr:hypothetical protein CBR_g68753 [Chara braunii]|eukprot:GBG66767.1 hypothetical protein CBR_g68753 [Chara braunii]